MKIYDSALFGTIEAIGTRRYRSSGILNFSKVDGGMIKLES